MQHEAVSTPEGAMPANVYIEIPGRDQRFDQQFRPRGVQGPPAHQLGEAPNIS